MDGISPSLRYFPLVPHQLDHPAKLPGHGRVMIYPEFDEFNRASGPTAFAFGIDIKAPISSFSAGSTPRACIIGRWGDSSIMASLS